MQICSFTWKLLYDASFNDEEEKEMNHKEELEAIKKKLIEIERSFAVQVSSNMHNRKILNDISNISCYLVASYRNVGNALEYVDKYNLDSGEKYNE